MTIIDLNAQILSNFKSLRGTGTTMHPINFDAEIPQSFCIKGLWVCDTTLYYRNYVHKKLLFVCVCVCVCVFDIDWEKN